MQPRRLITTAEEFARLRSSDDLDEQAYATDSELAPDVWADVMAQYPHLRGWLAHNKNVPLSVLCLLAGDADEEVRHLVAGKRKLDEDLFARLAKDPEPTVRHRLACNASIPSDVLERLARDPEDFVAEEARRRLTERRTDPGLRRDGR